MLVLQFHVQMRQFADVRFGTSSKLTNPFFPMKVRTLRRDHSQQSGGGGGTSPLTRECPGDIARRARNLHASIHPLAREREYQRAVNAAKLDRMFAKPFLGDFYGGHNDAVTTLCISRRALVPCVSGAADGSVKLWDIATRQCVTNLPHAHTRVVTGSVFDISGQFFYSCSDDGYIHRWSIHPTNHQNNSKSMDYNHTEITSSSKSSSSSSRSLAIVPKRATTKSNDDSNDHNNNSSHGPIMSWRTNGSFKSIDHHWFNDVFATASDAAIQIWTPERSTSIQTHYDLWGTGSGGSGGGGDTINVVRYNPSERDLIAHCCVDRGIGLHDTRTASALQKVLMKMRCNDLQWNPMEPMNLVVANEDTNAYTFDIRKLNHPTRIYKGHVNAVLSCSWSPTGVEFVCGSYDRTIRIFSLRDKVGKARDIYHTQRMQRVHNVIYTQDNKYILSASDDTNIRLWKARASERLGQLSSREEEAISYRHAILNKYQHVPTVAKIYHSRKVPKMIQKMTAQTILQKEKQHTKQSNRIKYNSKKPGASQYTFVNEKKQAVVQTLV
jgi:DDB1- and CUL4-associated factor 13